MARVNTFDEWVDHFHLWQQEVGVDPMLLGDLRQLQPVFFASRFCRREQSPR
jgi:hypothetical protein